MATEEEAGFTFVDKRRVKADATPEEASSQSASEAKRESTPTDTSAPQDTPMRPPSVQDRILMCIEILHQGAWIAMGLIANPVTGKIERDLAQARMAIDSVAFLAEKVEGDLDEATRREIKRVVSDLQMNFVRQMQRPE